MNKNEEEILWKKYSEAKDRQIRNQIAIRYYGLVEYIASKINFDMNLKEDLINTGIIKLLEAIEKYKLDGKVKFITYAYYKIYGGMIDYLRSLKNYSHNKKLNLLNKALYNLRNNGIEQPSDEQIANEMNLKLKDFYNFLENLYVKKINSYDELIIYEKYEILNEFELKNIISDIIDKKLNDVEKKVIRLYYYDDLTFKEIGDILKLTEARISQIHAIAITKIKVNIQFAQKLLTVK